MEEKPLQMLKLLSVKYISFTYKPLSRLRRQLSYNRKAKYETPVLASPASGEVAGKLPDGEVEHRVIDHCPPTKFNSRPAVPAFCTPVVEF